MLTVSEWIKANKLSSLKLTFMDIVSHTIVESRPKKISYGDKEVEITSKIWDEVRNNKNKSSTHTVLLNNIIQIDL